MRNILLFSLLLLSTSFLFAQTEWTLNADSSVNSQIAANPADVYLAESGDVLYFDATLTVDFDLHIKGASSDWIYNQTAPPIFVPIPDGAGEVNIFLQITSGSLTLENVLWNGRNSTEGGDIIDGFINESGATKIIIDNCSFSDMAGNVLATNSNPDIVSITNCVFINSFNTSSRPWGGHLGRFNTLGPELVIENNTFVNSGRLLGNGGHFYKSNITMNHNTWLNVQTEAVELHYKQALYANNIWSNWCWLGRTPADVAYNFSITTFEFYADLATDSVSCYFGRNLLYRDPKIKEHYDNVLIDSAEVSGYIEWNTSVDSTIENDDNFTIGKSYWDIDPGFTKDAGNLDKMLEWLTYKYVDGDEWPDWRFPSPVTYDVNGLPVVNWPPDFDLTYSNEGLKGAATDGLPMGDLNWYPSDKATYMANRSAYIAALEDSITSAGSVYTPGDPASGHITKIVNAIDNKIDNLPGKYSLSQNYPNPFNPSTTIEFSVAEAGKISLKIFDISGKLVKTVVDEKQTVGTHEVTIDMSAYSSGVYFTVLNNGSHKLVRKMMLIK